MKNREVKTLLQEYLRALWRYLQSPKTVFDIKDRGKALALFILVVILLQIFVELMLNRRKF